jgi:hypothetical protein
VCPDLTVSHGRNRLGPVGSTSAFDHSHFTSLGPQHHPVYTQHVLETGERPYVPFLLLRRTYQGCSQAVEILRPSPRHGDQPWIGPARSCSRYRASPVHADPVVAARFALITMVTEHSLPLIRCIARTVLSQASADGGWIRSVLAPECSDTLARLLSRTSSGHELHAIK